MKMIRFRKEGRKRRKIDWMQRGKHWRK